MSNREWIFKSRPGPAGVAETDFQLRTCPVPVVGDGQLLVAPHLFSMDPTMRNALAGPEVAARAEGSVYYQFMNWEPGQVPSWRSACQVVESRADGFRAGDMVLATAPWRELSCISPKGVEKIPPGVAPDAAMSVFGGTGMTGYMGSKFIHAPKDGDVAFVSAAAGATGLVACQTLKLNGCRVIGSAGSDDKVALLQSLGVESFNYKKETTLAGLRRLCPDGITFAFDNVGGETLEAAIEMMNDYGRVVLCGAISQYDRKPEDRYGVKNLFHVVAKQLKLEGFVVWRFTPEQVSECTSTLAKWVREGAIKVPCTFIDGFDKLPNGILGLFEGANTGKMLVRMPLRSKL